jgi:hypothetical protein
MILMKNILAIAAALLPLGAALAETPADRNVIAPYRFPPSSERTAPSDRSKADRSQVDRGQVDRGQVDRGRAELYRDQLRGSQNRREQLNGQGKLDTLGRRELQDLRGETNRMERTLER